MMRSPRQLLLLCLLVLVLPACTYRFGPESLNDFGRYLTLQPGVSTTQDVYERFGQPVDVIVTNDAGHTWEYLYATAQMHAATCIPYVGCWPGGTLSI